MNPGLAWNTVKLTSIAPTGSGLLTDGLARPKPVPTIIRAFEAPHNGGSDERIVVLGIGPDAASAGVGNGDTTEIRTRAEDLP